MDEQTTGLHLMKVSSEAHIHMNPRCDSCVFLLRSETSSTGLRCGHAYFKTDALLRRFKVMGQYAVVKPDTACGDWQSQPALSPVDQMALT